MHIPDGFLDVKTVVTTGVMAAAGLGLALRQARQQVVPARRPLMGLTAAFVFAAQMINFPVLGGTSGHLIGSVLSAILLGPSAAIVVMSSVLIVQCLLFNDGGLLSLGANLFNMAIAATLAGYGLYRSLHALFPSRRGMIFATAFAGWGSTVVAAGCCAAQLAASGTAAWSTVVPAMINIHMIIGVGEGLITALVLTAILRVRPQLFASQPAQWHLRQINRPFILGGVVVALTIAALLSPWASSWPDGLERIAQNLGFENKTVTSPLAPAPLSDYQFPGLSTPMLATAWAGVIGVLVVMLLSYLLARILVPGQAGPTGRDRP